LDAEMSDDDRALVPIEERQVEFYGDELTAVRTSDGTVYVPIRPICRLLGLNWDGQRRRIQRDAVLSQEAKGVVVTTTPGGKQEMTSLPLDHIAGFLFGINANRVKAELRDRVILYQRECYRVLSEAFYQGRLTSTPSFDELLKIDSPAVRAYQMALAIVDLARSQVIMEGRLDDYGRRLEAIEATLGDPDRYISNAQASRISQAVKAVAMALSKVSGRNEYGGVYGELYRRYDVASYRELPASEYEGTMSWLQGWYQQLTDRDLPF
jgi:hypothetical protein